MGIFSFKKIKKQISEYFISTAWPWEIVSGLFIVLIMINESKNFIDNQLLSKTRLVILIATINLLWAAVDGLLLIFTNLLERGRYNKMISTIKASDKNLATQTISNELSRTIINVLDEKDKDLITETVLEKILLLSANTAKKFRISSRDILGSAIVIFFVFSPSILILPFFLFTSNLGIAILISNIIGILILFGFGYKLGDCIKRNKILTGLTVAIIGLAVMIAGTVLGA
jgi:VIT1/CCC1 family predicted Fe2+/Mn2+ transporter